MKLSQKHWFVCPHEGWSFQKIKKKDKKKRQEQNESHTKKK